MATIVVMDDDEVILRLVCRVLEMGGHHVDAFPDAGPALEDVDFEKVDLVITDLSMPTSGEILIQTLRERGIQTPVIVLTGHITEDKAQYLKLLGAREILRKPFDLKEFLEMVRSLV